MIAGNPFDIFMGGGMGMDDDFHGINIGGFGGRPTRCQKRPKVEKKQDPPIHKDLKVCFVVHSIHKLNFIMS